MLCNSLGSSTGRWENSQSLFDACRFLRCLTIDDSHSQCAQEIRFTWWPKPCRYHFPLQQPVIRQRDTGDWLQSHLFGLLDAPRQVVERISIQRILNDFLDLGREDKHFQFGPDHCALTRATMNQRLIEQGILSRLAS
jgi:hypothetical protein